MAQPLGLNADRLHQLLLEVQRQQQPSQQDPREPAAKRTRLEDAPAAGVLSLLDAAQAACLPSLVPLPSLSLLPLDLSCSGSATLQQAGSGSPLLQSAGSGSPLLQSAGSGSMAGGHAFLPTPAAAAAAQDQRQAAQQAQQAQQAPGPLPAAVLPPAQLPPAHASGPELLLAAMLHQQQQAGVCGASGSGEGTRDSSAEEGSAEGQAGAPSQAAQSKARQQGAGRRNHEERVTANKEKNRKAQQRFRLRQKEKLAWLESELTRLRELLAAHGIDPSPTAPPPAAVRTAAEPGPDSPAAAATAGSPAAAAAAAVAAMAAAQPAPWLLPLPQAALLQAPPPAPSTEQMYEEVEQILERCAPAIPGSVAIAYLTAWQRADGVTQRCQYSSLKKRSDSGRTAEIGTCVNVWLSAAAAAPAAVPPQQAQQAVQRTEQAEQAEQAPTVQQVATQAAQLAPHALLPPLVLQLAAQQMQHMCQPPALLAGVPLKCE